MADGKKSEESFGTDKKTSSPYTLNSNDNPGNLITQVQLKGENYEEWAQATRTTLRAKKKYDWWTVNSMLVSWVFNTIELTLHSTISHMENTKDLWEDIKQRFLVGNGPRMQQLRSDLANCRQNGQPIMSYFGKLKILWDEINNYDQIPVCVCTSCICNFTIELERKCEEERVHQFLMGLDEEGYGRVSANILSTEPLPNLNRVYAMVVQQERVRTMTRTKDERGNPMSFAIRAGGQNSRGGKDKTPFCFNCNREGHDAESCFQLIGYPEWWDRKGLSGLNDEQWATLLGMLSSHQNGGHERLTGKQSIFPWIIEIRASHHMTRTLVFLRELCDLVPCLVELPDGEKTMAMKEGTVLLGGDLKLRRALFDLNSRNLIGAGEQHEGLYFLKGVTSVHACTVADKESFEL
ncbi:hypothetical protein EUGRSUZ_K02658 [Eucalyptus grandis]|uniref:Uncharacterized protein n=2 Tax=Eucalyptus grandis TaxID=71139 RepID=A0ACC3IXJ3_EUCGR|nr:hypothetical protein EUGRSUZ_K02658 [Eucalyptus grandis]